MKLGTKVKIIDINRAYPSFTDMFKCLGFKNPDNYDWRKNSHNDSGLWETFSPVVKHFDEDTLMVAIQQGEKQLLINVDAIKVIGDPECFIEDLNTLKIVPKEKARLLEILKLYDKI